MFSFIRVAVVMVSLYSSRNPNQHKQGIEVTHYQCVRVICYLRYSSISFMDVGAFVFDTQMLRITISS